jgi:hypothetical protein
MHYSWSHLRNFNRRTPCWIWGSHGDAYEEYGFLGCNSVWWGETPMFQRNTSPQASMSEGKPSQKIRGSRLHGELSVSQGAAWFRRLGSLSDTGNAAYKFHFRHTPARNFTVHQRTCVWVEFCISFPGYKSCELSSVSNVWLFFGTLNVLLDL